MIKVLGKVAHHWEHELRMQLTHTETELGTVSTLRGALPDQAAMLGTLGQLAMWGYLILFVRYEYAPDDHLGGDDGTEW